MTEKPSKERFRVHYRITVRDERSIQDHAEDIAVEQTVEVPPQCIPQSHHDEGIPGRIEEISTVEETSGVFDVAMSYRCDVTAFSIPQFLNTLFGNISMKNNIRIMDVEIPETLARAFAGPTFGIDGVRGLLGVYERPLACSAIKPMGLGVEKLAAMAESLAEGGVDLIKDDHGIGNQHFHPFLERIPRVQEAVDRANARTGRTTIYLPMISGGFDSIEEQVRFAVRHGVRGILVAPMLVGLDTLRHFAQTYRVVVMAHPALAGSFLHDRSHGMSHALLLGTLFRLAGADASVFPNAGGRFPFTHTDCSQLCDALRRAHPVWKPAFPVPAGGMGFDQLDEMAERYGADTILLIGGGLMREGPDLRGTTAKFLDAIKKRFGEKLVTPAASISSCEWHSPAEHGPSSFSVLRFDHFRWQGRNVQQYKVSDEIAFQGVTRQELVSATSSKTSFDVRYFEIEPGGYTSFEKHVHEHVIIVARGEGVLRKGDDALSLAPNDIAYTAPLQNHQLRNTGNVPFGFYCIVDRIRDRPLPT